MRQHSILKESYCTTKMGTRSNSFSDRIHLTAKSPTLLVKSGNCWIPTANTVAVESKAFDVLLG